MKPDTSNRQIRVFLSSTFADMQSERDYLVKNIFPSLKTECRRRNVDFSVVDLRWGITEQESKSGKVIEICIDEINRTRPFFIGLLGGRYGWIPDEKECRDNARLAQKYPWINDCISQKSSITEMEMEYGALASQSPVYAQFYVRSQESIPKRWQETESLKIEKLQRLKNKIAKASEEGRCLMENYSSPQQLGSLIYNSMMNVINELYPADESHGIYDALCARQHAIENRLRKIYVPIDDCNLDFGYLDALNRKRLVVGKHGIGKSAFLANWKADCHNDAMINGIFIHREGNDYEYDDTDSDAGADKVFVPIIRNYIDSELNTFEECKRLLLLRLAKIYPQFDSESITAAVSAPAESPVDLRSFFNKYGFNEKFIWIIDGIDRMVGEGDTNAAFSSLLPENVSLVISSADNNLAHLSQRFDVITLNELSPSKVIEIVEAYLKEYAKRLTDAQRMHIAGNKLMRNPAMLSIMLEELLQFGVFEQLDNYINSFLRATTPQQFIDTVLNRLDADFPHAGTMFSLLALSKIGIAETELMRILKLNAVEWASLYGASQSMLSENGGYLQLRSEVIAEAVLARYVTDTRSERRLRSTLVDSLLRSNKWISKKIEDAVRKEQSIFGLWILKLISYIPLPIADDSPFGIFYRRNLGELMRQYAALGKYRKLCKIMSHSQSLFSVGLFEFTNLLRIVYDAGYHPVRKWLSHNILLRLTIMLRTDSEGNFDNEFNDFVAYILMAISSMIMFIDEEKRNKELKHISRQLSSAWFIKRSTRRRILEVFNHSIKGFQPDYVSSDNIEDSWEPGNSYNITDVLLLINNVETMLSEERIDHICNRAMAMVGAEETDNKLFSLLAVVCLVRLRRFELADNLLNGIEISTGCELLLLRIDIMKRLLKKDTSNDTLKQIESMKNFNLNDGSGNIEIFYETYLLLYNLLKSPFRFAADEAINRIDSLLSSRGDEERANTLCCLARRLQIIEHHSAAAKAYIVVSQQCQELNDKADSLRLAGECFYKCQEYGNANKLYNQASECYHKAGNASWGISCHYKALLSLCYSGNYSELLSLCNQAIDDDSIKQSPNYSNFINLAAMAHQKAIKADCGIAPAEALNQAFSLYNQALMIEADDAESVQALSLNLVLLISENLNLATDEQIKAALHLTEKYSEMHQFQYYRFILYEHLGRIDEAINEALTLNTKRQYPYIIVPHRIDGLRMKSADAKQRRLGYTNALHRLSEIKGIVTSPTNCFETIINRLDEMIQVVESDGFDEYISSIDKNNNIDVLFAMYCTCEHMELREQADLFIALMRDYVANHHSDEGFNVDERILSVVLIPCYFAEQLPTAAALVIAVADEYSSLAPEKFSLSTVIGILDAIVHTDDAFTGTMNHHDYANAIAQVIGRQIDSAGNISSILADAVDLLDKLNDDIAITVIEGICNYVARLGSVAISDEGTTLAQAITSRLLNCAIDSDNNNRREVFKKCALTPVETITETDYNDIPLLMRKTKAFSQSAMPQWQINNECNDVFCQLMWTGHFEHALEVCQMYECDLVNKVQCLVLLNRIAEADELCHTHLESDNRIVMLAVLTAVLKGDSLKAMGLIDRVCVDEATLLNTLPINIVKAIAYVKQGLVDDAKEIYTAEIDDEDAELRCIDINDPLWMDDRLYIALYHIALAWHHAQHGNSDEAKLELSLVSKITAGSNVPLLKAEYAKVEQCL